jgi:hypothetical protein
LTGEPRKTVISHSEQVWAYKKLVCFTTCGYKNNEYLVAKEAADAKGYEHIFVPKRGSYYSDIIEEATYLGSGMCGYGHAHFLNLKDAFGGKADVLFHGYGLDFLFRGKYLPASIPQPLQKITNKRRLKSMGTDKEAVADSLISGLSYRLKDADPTSLVKPAIRNKMRESLRTEILRIIEEASRLSGDPYKWWDHCLFHNISRHYTWLNISSIRSFAEERTLAFSNDLLDLFWSLDPHHRMNDTIFVEALKQMDPGLLKIRIANSNLLAGENAFISAGKMALNKTLKRAGLGRVFNRCLPPPSLRERSWHVDAGLVREDNVLRERAIGLCRSGALEDLGFLDMDSVSKCVRGHIEGKGEYTTLILSLITLDELLRGR